MTEPTTTEAGKYVIGKARWDAGMRGHFIRMFTLTGPQDVQIMVGKIEAEAVAAERARLAEQVRGLDGQCHDGEGLGCQTDPCIENVSREDVLHLLAPTEGGPDDTRS